MRTARLVAAGAAALALAAVPLPAGAQAEGKTRVVVLVVDGLRPDEVARMPTLSQLAAQGTYYTESRSVMVAETIPNHVSMVTGAYPDRTGIVANDYPAVAGTGTPEDLLAEGDVVSSGDPRLLQADSVFTLVARQCPQLTASAVTSKDYLYTVMEHDRDGDGQRDADSNFANVDDPTFIPGLGLTPDERTVLEAVRVSQAQDPDFLFVNLGSVDRFGHVDVTGGVANQLLEGLPAPEVQALRTAQLLSTDTQVGAIGQLLKSTGKWDSTALLVTADHSMDWSGPADGVTVSDNPDIADVVDEFVVAQNGGAALYSLRDRTRPDRFELLKRLRDSALATDGVDEVLYREPNPLDGGEQHWVGAVHPDWHQTGPRSGDLLVTVDDGRRSTEPTSTSNPIPGNHGMPSTLRIPVVVSGGLGVVQRTVTGSADPDVRAADQAENVDMAPTAAWLLGVDPPAAGFDGRALTEAFTARPADACVAAASSGGTPSPAAAPGTSGPRLPATGPWVLLPAAGALAVAAAWATRRRP